MHPVNKSKRQKNRLDARTATISSDACMAGDETRILALWSLFARPKLVQVVKGVSTHLLRSKRRGFSETRTGKAHVKYVCLFRVLKI